MVEEREDHFVFLKESTLDIFWVTQNYVLEGKRLNMEGKGEHKNVLCD